MKKFFKNLTLHGMFSWRRNENFVLFNLVICESWGDGNFQIFHLKIFKFVIALSVEAEKL